MPDVVIYGDTLRSPELRHEVPIGIADPFVYLECDGSRQVFVGSLELPRLEALENLQVAPLEELGADVLVAAGLSYEEFELELLLRACRRVGVEDAVVPRTFPLQAADHLRANGIGVRAEGALFDRRRRSKTEAEIAGVRRAQRACEAAMDAIREGLRAGGCTCEELQERVLRAFSRAGVIADDLPIVSHGAQTAVGHEVGHGPIAEGEAIVADLFPQDPLSGCYADMTRTFCLGDPPAELAEYHRLCREALELVVPAIRPGVPGLELFRLVAELFERRGHRTHLSKRSGEVLESGFFHSLGHGVGLEVHEHPGLGRLGREELVPGDVLAIEPGLYRKGFGGCRLEDLVLVTEDGCEVITDYPYELAP